MRRGRERERENFTIVLYERNNGKSFRFVYESRRDFSTLPGIENKVVPNSRLSSLDDVYVVIYVKQNFQGFALYLPLRLLSSPIVDINVK